MDILLLKLMVRK
uniref:Uncharacterized protein n=1 Tax=Arundo donax TaxID=35708 RepID=A0A0A8YP05_ARUDO